MLLVDDGEAEVGEDDILLKQRVRADDDVEFACRQPRQRRATFRRLVAPGHQGHTQASFFGERRHPVEMLARQDFRRRHHRRLPPRFDHLGHRKQGHDRLARADVALQQPDHALFGSEIGTDVVERLPLRAGERKRQRRLESANERAFGEVGAPDRLPHPGTDEQQGELVRQQFVEGQTGRGAAFRVDVLGRRRSVHHVERFGERWQLQAFDRIGSDPFRHAR